MSETQETQEKKKSGPKKPHDTWFVCAAVRKSGDLVFKEVNAGSGGTAEKAKEIFKEEFNITPSQISMPMRKRNVQQSVSRSEKFVQVPLASIDYQQGAKSVFAQAMGWNVIAKPLSEVKDKAGRQFKAGEIYHILGFDSPVDPDNRQPKPRINPALIQKKDLKNIESVSNK